jgi:hypothetical protein
VSPRATALGGGALAVERRADGGDGHAVGDVLENTLHYCGLTFNDDPAVDVRRHLAQFDQLLVVGPFFLISSPG